VVVHTHERFMLARINESVTPTSLSVCNKFNWRFQILFC
jgi:hypothetical protein